MPPAPRCLQPEPQRRAARELADEVVGGLGALETLRVERNALVALPETIGDLSRSLDNTLMYWVVFAIIITTQRASASIPFVGAWFKANPRLSWVYSLLLVWLQLPFGGVKIAYSVLVPLIEKYAGQVQTPQVPDAALDPELELVAERRRRSRSSATGRRRASNRRRHREPRQSQAEIGPLNPYAKSFRKNQFCFRKNLFLETKTKGPLEFCFQKTYYQN